MNTSQEVIIAALVAKLGGEVHISVKEYMAAEEAELMRLGSPDFGDAMAFKVRDAHVTSDGEDAPQGPLRGPGSAVPF